MIRRMNYFDTGVGWQKNIGGGRTSRRSSKALLMQVFVYTHFGLVFLRIPEGGLVFV